MKGRFKLLHLLITVAIIAILAVSAFAAGNFSWTKNKTSVQHLSPLAPEKGQSGCVTQAITKGTFGKYTSVDGYVGYSAEVVTAAGAAETVKWELDGNQVAVGSKFEFVNTGANTYKRAVQRVYSAPSRSLTSCVRRQ